MILLVFSFLFFGRISMAYASWTTYQGNPSHTGYVPLTLTSNFSERWVQPLNSTSLDPVTAADGMVFVSKAGYGNNNQLFAVTAEDGQIIWNKDLGYNNSVNPLAYNNGILYVQAGHNSSDDYLRAYTAATGEQIFQSLHSTRSEYCAPTIYDGNVYINGGEDAGVYTFDGVTGEQLWSIELDDENKWTHAVNEDYVFAFKPIRLTAINRQTGAEEFTISHPCPSCSGSSEELAPVLGSQKDVIAVYSGRLFSFDLIAKNVKWEIARDFDGQPSVANGKVYAISAGALTVRNEHDGAQLWTWEPPDGGILEGTLVVTDSHIFASTYSATYAIDLGTHEQVWTYAAGGKLALSEETLYIAENSGSLAAIDVQIDSTKKIIISIPDLAEEGTGALSNSGIVSINTRLDYDLQVDISSSDSLKVTVPSIIIIPAGETMTSFDLAILDDNKIDGMQLITINASADNFISDEDIISITDNDNEYTSSDSWPTYQGNPFHTGYVPVTLGPSFNERWVKTFSTVPLNRISAADGMVLVSTHGYYENQELFAVSTVDGKIGWEKDFGDIASVGSPVYNNGIVYLQTSGSDSYLRAYNAITGNPIFQSPYDDDQYTRFIYDNNVFIVGGYGVYGFDGLTGKQLWFINLKQAVNLAINEEFIFAYAYRSSGELTVINRKTGEEEFSITDPNFSEVNYSLNLAPVLGSENNVIVINNGRLINFDLTNKNIKWEIDSEFSDQPSVANGQIYAISSGILSVRNEHDGAQLWSLEPPNGESLKGTMVITDSHLFVGTGAATYAIDLGTHEQVWTYPIGGKLALADGVLYIAADSGTLAAIQTEVIDCDYDNDGIYSSVEGPGCTDPNNADSDDDGLPDGEEDANHSGIVDSGETDPCNADTDGDGMPDGWEIQYLLNPLIKNATDDNDKDGLTDLQEYNNGTDPILKDTDNDGMSDGFEINHFGNNERNGSGDYDNDGVSDRQEYYNVTNPVDNADSDTDGMADDWEINYFRELSRDGTDDFDDDGLTDIEEYEAGSNPVLVVAAYPVMSSPMIESPFWMAESNLENAEFGSSIACAGDVNGDGYSDVILGAPGFNNDSGKVFVYYGSASGLSSAAGWTAEGTEENARFGSSVTPAGDVNGDGYSDVIISASNHTDEEGYKGAIYLYYGSPAGLSSTADWIVESSQTDHFICYYVEMAGDVNDNGYSDVIIITGSLVDNKFERRMLVYYGSSSGLSSAPDREIESDMGFDSSAIGDVNGDGYSDVITEKPFQTIGEVSENRILVYYGSSTGLNSTPGWMEKLESHDYIVCAEDANKDGYSDVIMRNWRDDSIYTFYGSTVGLRSNPGWALGTDSSEANTTSDMTQSLNAGGASSGSVIISWESPWLMDWIIKSSGDVNADGYLDIIVGVYSYNWDHNKSHIYIYYGSLIGPGTTPGWIIEPAQENTSFGSSIAGAGDVNGDGYSDIVVGAPHYDNEESNEGAAFVFYGSSFDDDTDGDLIPDGIEKKYCSDSNDLDTDDDGLFDGEEDVNHNGILDMGETNPCNADTDGDGMPDDWEIQYDFDPLIGNNGNDYDDDGVTDLQEYQNGTNPVIKADTDSDNIPDDWEIAYFEGTSRDGAGDFDGDGLTDLAEYEHKTKPTFIDTDWDGYTDGEEVICGSDPILHSDTPESHRPSKPVFTEDTDTTDVSLRYHLFKADTYSDPDGDSLFSSEWQISADVSFSEDKIILHKTLELGTGILVEESDLLLFTMSETLFLADKDYWIRVKLTDSTGLSSVWSDPLTFFTVMENPYDLDVDGIDDQYEAGQDTDTNTNGVNDSEEGILAVSDAEQGKTTGVSINNGTLSGLTSLSTADLPDGILGGIQMPYGLFSYRVDGLTPGEEVNITFYFPEAIPSDAGWYKYDSADGDIYDYTENISIDGSKVVLTITDGGPGDEDGLANGIIIDPSGPVFAQDTDTDTDTDDGTANNDSGGGGGCFIATAAYGSAQEHHVMILREFRDRFLLKYRLGRVFVVQYYKYSPPMADYIAQHDMIRMFVRWGLFPIVGASYLILWIDHLAGIFFFMPLLFVISVLTICFYLKASFGRFSH